MKKKLKIKGNNPIIQTYNFEYKQPQQIQNPMMGIPYPMTIGMGYPYPLLMYGQLMYQQIVNPQMALYNRQMMLPFMPNMNSNNIEKNNIYLRNFQNKNEGFNDN